MEQDTVDDSETRRLNRASADNVAPGGLDYVGVGVSKLTMGGQERVRLGHSAADIFLHPHCRSKRSSSSISVSS